MRDWVSSEEGDKSVKLDVCDLGSHLDTTFRGWSALVVWVNLVIVRLMLVSVGETSGCSHHVHLWSTTRC